MRFGVVILPEYRWPEAARRWQRAEQLGFAHAWTYDHLAWRGLVDSPWFATVPTLSAAALATKHLRIGTLVASPNFRHPVPFAKELMTIDDLSEGRLTLGIGSGGTGWDAAMLGQVPWSPTERRQRFAEFVELTDLLLRQPATTFAGRFYSATEARSLPGCVQQPRIPFAVAATGAGAMNVAATFGQCWVTTGDREAVASLDAGTGSRIVGAQMERLDEVCHRAGRDPSTLDRMVLSGVGVDPGLSSPAQFDDTVGRYESVGVTDFVVHWPRDTEPFRGERAGFEAIFSR
jgi:alkanesulfonate monooxygenase SsuD/methylene tetrahydromethanopterin reductase-like flavin-dependent oxidoreductase (luciferase family)